MRTTENKRLIESIINDAEVRKKITKESHEYFLPIYLGNYMQYPNAPFHDEMIRVTEDEDETLSVIVAFRGSAKSTIFSLSYPIWSILGKQEKKFVLILSQTQIQARQILSNIKSEMENNNLLKDDLGPFEEPDDEWRSTSIVIPKYGARIMVASTEQSIRGIRHKSHRPDLIIFDDIEDLSSTKTIESRDKTFRWLSGEVLPAGDLNTKVVVIGNLVHEDSVIMRLKNKIEKKEINGEFYSYPIMDDEGESLWPGKFPDKESLKREEMRVLNLQAWFREYLLKIIPEDGQIIEREWIRYYEKIPDIKSESYLGTIIAIDPASSLKPTADYTAMVALSVFDIDEERKIYIHRQIINERMTPFTTAQKAKDLLNSVGKIHSTKFIVEGNGYQVSLAEALTRE
ncbi:hypothetical protein KKC45_02410, partial [Patescibacteria group bacterium]|nr:hypothetical protein [Patescibacteria group bacterium]